MDFLQRGLLRLSGEAVRQDQFVRAFHPAQQAEYVSGEDHAHFPKIVRCHHLFQVNGRRRVDQFDRGERSKHLRRLLGIKSIQIFGYGGFSFRRLEEIDDNHDAYVALK